VEYESRRDADDAYHEMHNKRMGRDDLLKIEVCLPSLIEAALTPPQADSVTFQWARTPPSASWRFDPASREARPPRRDRSPRRRSRSPPPRSRDRSPRKDDRRERDYDRRDRDRATDRSRSPDDVRDRDMKDRDRARSEEETEPLGAGLENGDDEGRKGTINTRALDGYGLTRGKIHHVWPKTSSTLRSETIDLLILVL